MALSTRKPILISGAGVSSLLLAQSLLRASIPFLLFERDNSISFRAQGYRLRLSSDGLDAVESVLGPEKFQKFWDKCSKTGGGGFGAVNAITGVVDSKSSEAGGPEKAKDPEGKGQPNDLESRGGKIVGIARGDMRKLFLSGCESYIKWGHNVKGYELTSSGVRAVFSDGSKSVEGDMLVGGEGIYSKVAKQLSEGKLKTFDTLARGIHGQAPSTAFKGLGEGVWRMVDETKPNGKVFVITNVRPGDKDDPEEKLGWTLGAQPGVVNAPNDDYTIVGRPAAEIAKELTKDWHPRLKPLFEQMDESEAAFWKITCSTPTGVPEWPNQSRVTVIGDAVHSMTPAGGLGANCAMKDAALVGKLITDAGGYKDGITAAYEKEMRVYGSSTVAASYGMASTSFGVSIDENSPTV